MTPTVARWVLGTATAVIAVLTLGRLVLTIAIGTALAAAALVERLLT